MITDHQVQRIGTDILLGIAVENAVLDMLTSESQLHECVEFLEKPHPALECARMGMFGIYPVTLSVYADDPVSIFVDGPYFDQSRNVSAGLYLDKQELLQLLRAVLSGQTGGTLPE